MWWFHTCRRFPVSSKKYQCMTCHKFENFANVCYQMKHVSSKPRKPKALMLQVGAVYACGKSICSHPEDLSSSDDSFCFQVKIQHTQSDCKKIPTPSHLIINLAYSLKPNNTRNQYLRARLDTWLDVNIMPASVYKLDLKIQIWRSLLLVPSTLAHIPQRLWRIAGSCVFYMIHLYTKKWHWVTSYHPN